MKTEIEFYLLRIYLHKAGWRVTFIETQNFDTGRNWWLLAFGWNRQDGVEVSVGG